MAVSYEVYLQADRLPDAAWLESTIRGVSFVAVSVAPTPASWHHWETRESNPW
jgi:hypothetical protein